MGANVVPFTEWNCIGGKQKVVSLVKMAENITRVSTALELHSCKCLFSGGRMVAVMTGECGYYDRGELLLMLC